MKEYGKHRFPWFLIIVGVAIVLCTLPGILQSRGVLQYCVIAPQDEKAGVAIKQLIENQEEICEEMQDSLITSTIGGVKLTMDLSSGEASEAATMYALGEGWFEVYPRFLVEGRRISESELERGDRVVMLDEKLAFKLFGSELPENAEVKLKDKAYSVVGTVRHSRGIGDVQDYNFYVPMIAVAADGILMDTLMVSALPIGQSNSAKSFEDAMRNQWQAGGSFIQLSKEAMGQTMILRLLLLAVGLYALIALLKRMNGLVASWFSSFSNALKDSYFKVLIPRLVGLIALSLLGYAVLLLVIWQLMAFSVKPLYVFTEWVPENIAEWSSIAGVFWDRIGASAKLVRIGSRELRVLEFWGGLLRGGTVMALLGVALAFGSKRSVKR